MNRRVMLGVILIIVGIAGLVAFSTIQFTPTYTGPVTKPFPAQTAPFPTTPIPGPYQPYPLIPGNIDEATELAKGYVASLGYPDLGIKEIMEFQYNYYFIVYEKSTGIGAYEGIVEKGVGLSGMGGMMGVIHPEQGPNMMWNTKYGHMGGMMGGGMMGGMMGRGWGYQPYIEVPTAVMPVTEEEAAGIAQAYLDSYLPGSTIEHPDTFYGYYTVHVLRDGKVYGMLSVNGYTGQVWYHTWHGAFIQMKELT
ncbi:hypothetical protein KEJ39_06970 [Candidatus Bathyarchaeota archaeon]|nr:hypothetical protein [Candidatus Bathyarchaeota archaeon]